MINPEQQWKMEGLGDLNPAEPLADGVQFLGFPVSADRDPQVSAPEWPIANLSGYTEKDVEIARQHAVIQNLTAENLRLNGILESGVGVDVVALTAECKRLRVELHDANNAYAALAAENERLRTEDAGFQLEAADLGEELAKKEAELANLNASIEGFNSMLADANEIAEIWHKRYYQIEANNTELSKKIGELEATLVTLSRRETGLRDSVVEQAREWREDAERVRKIESGEIVSDFLSLYRHSDIYDRCAEKLDAHLAEDFTEDAE